MIPPARTVDFDRVAWSDPQRSRTPALGQLERQDTHADQVRAMNALEVLGARGARAELGDLHNTQPKPEVGPFAPK